MGLVRSVYLESKRWPPEEQFGLTSQVRRAAVSIPANIAEGKGRFGAKELLHHLSIAHGSLCEVETHLFVAQDLGYADEQGLAPVFDQTAEVGRLLRGLMKSLRQPPL
jgi:four helix bundle protein